MTASRCFACCCVTLIEAKLSSHVFSNFRYDNSKNSSLNRDDRVGGRIPVSDSGTNLSEYSGKIDSSTGLLPIPSYCLYRSLSSSCVGFGTLKLEAGAAAHLYNCTLSSSIILLLFFAGVEKSMCEIGAYSTFCMLGGKHEHS